MEVKQTKYMEKENINALMDMNVLKTECFGQKFVKKDIIKQALKIVSLVQRELFLL